MWNSIRTFAWHGIILSGYYNEGQIFALYYLQHIPKHHCLQVILFGTVLPQVQDEEKLDDLSWIPLLLNKIKLTLNVHINRGFYASRVFSEL